MNTFKKIALGASSALIGVSSFAAATSPDFSSLTDPAAFSGVTTAIMAIAVGLVGVVLTVKGARIVLAMLR